MWNEKYNREDYLYGTEPNDFLRHASLILGDERKILCLAEGEGRNAVFLAMQGHDVTAVDASSVGLEKAHQLAAANQVIITTIEADLADFDLGEQEWDAIIAIFCHLPPNLRRQINQAIPSALRPGGFYICEGYATQQLKHNTGGPKDENLLLQLEVCQTEIANLNWIHACEIEREIIEGSGHTGLGAVVQLIGQKPI